MKVYSNFYRIFSFSMAILLSLLCRAPQNLFSQERSRFLSSPVEVLTGSSLSRGYQHTGFKYFRNYSREDYNLQPQNWFILQDKEDRIIYIANHEGLLVYDGVSWRSIDIPNKSVRSLVIDDNGTIYVGGRNEFGYLITDEKGSLKYESLRGYIENNNQIHFTDVWKIHPTKEGTYFHTWEFLFRWEPNTQKIKPFPSPSSFPFRASFMVEGKLFIRQQNIGLREMVNGKLKTVPGGDEFSNQTIFMMVPYDNATKTFLIGTKLKGLYKYDYIKEKIAPFPTEVDDYIREKQLSHGIRLTPSSTSPGEPGGFALATRLGGLVIIDCNGRLKYKFNKTLGLQHNNINYVYEDVWGNLWLALNKGISKIEYASPISICDDRSGLTGLVLSVIKHHNDLYVGTTDGLFSLPYSSPGGFIPVPGIPGDCFSLLSIGDSLLAATVNGVFLVKPGVRRITKSASFVLLQSQKNKNRVWMETNNRLISLYFHTESKNKTGKWGEEHHPLKGLTADIRTIVEEKNGNLWLGTLTKGVLKVDFPVNGTMTNPVVTTYYTSHGLPEGEVHVFWAAGHVMFAAPEKGIFRFNKIDKRFTPDSTLGVEFAGGSKGVFRIVEDNNKNIWFHSDDQNFQARPGLNNTFIIKSEPFLRIPRTQVNSIYLDPEGSVVWFASNDGLIRYDKTLKKDYQRDFPTLIRDVLFNGKSLIFDDYKCKTEKDSKSGRTIYVINYPDRNIRFEFASTFFEGESSTQYRRLLEGYDKNWSEWTLEPNIDYTNLDAGQYTFKVQAKNVYNHLGSIAVYQFKVLPPWYKTWWALLICGLLIFLLMFWIVKWRSGKLKREKRKLERIVKARTKEIDEKNQQLEKQTIQLKEQSEKLTEVDKVKSRFFTNISHEFRTPLTLIMSPLEQMISENQDNEKQKKLNLMLRNSQRLLGLINQLMELAKFESGKMKLQACRQNIISFLKGIAASFESVVSKNELDLIFDADEENIDLYFDQGKMEEILFNLLSNAIKFTPPGGEITAKVTKKLEKEENFPSGSVDISVEDTGPGIPMDQIPHIFERFYQSDITYEHHLKGSGIGLSIAKELVELHHGTINVHSRENKGTEFIIRLPLGHAHLSPEEIIEPPAIPYQHKTVKEIPSLYIMEKQPKTPAEVKDNEAEPITKNDFDPSKQEKNIILVVEDSDDFRKYIKEALEPLYMVIEAANGQEGIQKAQEIIPDLIISDIMMPEVDGCELCRVIKNNIRTSHIPIILLTARSSEEGIIQGLETGADDYITKPFHIKILCARIKNLIDLRTHMQQTLKREMTQQPVKISVSQSEKVFIKKLKQIIDQNISDPDFNVTQMYKDLDLSQPTLYRKVYAITGESPTEFIRSYRLKRGAELLKENPDITIQEVALEVGFSSANYFTKCFKEKFHQLPSTYQASEAE